MAYVRGFKGFAKMFAVVGGLFFLLHGLVSNGVSVFYYQEPKISQIQYSSGYVLPHFMGRVTGGNSGINLNGEYFYCFKNWSGYSNCTQCRFREVCNQEGKTDVAKMKGKLVTVGWFKTPLFGKIVYSVNVNGMVLFGYSDAIGVYRKNYEEAKFWLAVQLFFLVVSVFVVLGKFIRKVGNKK